MEHDEAIRLRAAERYVARELSPNEIDAFEEHFFDCPECAEDVRFELTFAANLRTALREPPADRQIAPLPQPTLWQKWGQWLRLPPVLAISYGGNFVLAAALGFFLLAGGHEGVQPRFTPAYFAPGPTHGSDVHSLAAGEAAYAVHFPAPAGKGSTYSYEILNTDGKRELSGSLPGPAIAQEELFLEVPVRSLPTGVHTLEVHAGGPDGDIVSRSRFQTSR